MRRRAPALTDQVKTHIRDMIVQGEFADGRVPPERDLAEALGVKLVLSSTAWDGIIPALITSKCDLIMSGMTITKERAETIDFSAPYMVIGQTVLLRKDLDLGLSAAKELGVPMPLTSITRDLVQTLIGNGYTDQDFETLLLLAAKASGMELTAENVKVGDGLTG